MNQKLFLTKEKADKIHEASLEVLENTGVNLDKGCRAEEILLGAGAERDSTGRMLIPRKLVREALEKARAAEKIHVYDREGENFIEVSAGNTFFGPGSDALYNTDLETGEKRKSRLSDIADNVRIADALPNYDFMMTMALPEDVDSDKLYATAYAEMIKNTPKPSIVTSTDIRDMKQIHTVASIVAGGDQQFYDRPTYVAYIEPLSPLIMDPASSNRLIFCAEKGVPILFASGANCGSGAPITPEGGVVQGGAESLAGLVLATLVNEQARFIYGANTSAMDMRSTIVSYGDPVWFKTVAMYSEMGRYYGLPSWGTAGSSDSFKIDAQAAMEACEGISLAIMSESTLVHDVAYLAHGELYDARMLVLTDMMIGRAKHLLKPVDLSDEALAVDVIDEVSRGEGMYISHEHTSRNFKDALWLPPNYINRRYITDVMEGEFPDLLGREAKKILDEHKPKLLEEDVEKQVDSYIASL